MTTVLLVDDHPLFRDGLAQLIRSEHELEVVGEAGSATDATDIAALHTPDLVVMDVMLPDGDGITLARQLRARGCTRILGLSVLDEPMRIAELCHAGASGFAQKLQPAGEIRAAIRATIAGLRYLAPTVRERVEALLQAGAKVPFEKLTRREREIFDQLIRGSSNDAIGHALFIAPRTVDTHRHHIMRKLEAHSIADLVRLAARWGVLV